MKLAKKVLVQLLFAMMVWVGCNWSLKASQGYHPWRCVASSFTRSTVRLGIKSAHIPFPPPCDPCCACNGDCCEHVFAVSYGIIESVVYLVNHFE